MASASKLGETISVNDPARTSSTTQDVLAEAEPVVSTATPTSWWSYGLIALGIVIALLLVLQLLMGAPGSDVQSGTPTSAPVVQTPTPPQPGTGQ